MRPGVTPISIDIHPTARFAYVTTVGQPVEEKFNEGRVTAFSVDPVTGALTSIEGGTLLTERFPGAVVIDPTGRFVYVANRDSFSISLYKIDPTTGKLTEIASPITTGTAPVTLEVDPTGQFLYSLNGFDNTIRSFRINQTDGSLITNTDSVVATGPNSFSITVARSTRVCYTLDPSSNLTTLDIDLASGQLGSIGNPLPAGNGASIVTVDPTHRFAYVPCTGGSGSVSVFAIDFMSGNLTPAGSLRLNIPGSPVFVAVEPTGRFAYVANQGSTSQNTQSSVSVFNINRSTGMLWPVPDSTISPGGTGPITVSVDRTGRFAYVTVADIGNSTPGIFAFSINPATGMLTPNGSISLPSDLSNSLGLCPMVIFPTAGFAYQSDLAAGQIDIMLLDHAGGAMRSPFGAFQGPSPIFPIFLSLDPTGRFFYATESNGLFTLILNLTSGALSQQATGAGVSMMTVHPTARFLCAVDTVNTFSFTIDPTTGFLTQVSAIRNSANLDCSDLEKRSPADES